MTTTQTSTSSAVAPSMAPSDVQATVLEDRLTEQELMAKAFNTRCAFETDFPSNLLSGNMYVLVSEADKPGQPARIIDSNEAWLVDVYWYLSGQAASLICGQWRVKIFMESLGRDILDLEIPPAGRPVPMNLFNFYHVQFYIPPNYVRVEPTDGTPFEINVVTALIANNGRPSPIVGFCSLDPILFYYEAIEVSP
ncbi:MAG TPA: hypothetical protein VEL49_02425 [Ktedonobacteraceae bacterium]|nr:hypothetical protein [Ktedonobacteraceae bacterium]